MNLREKIGNQILIGDGAMGTMLFNFGKHVVPEEINLSNPDLISEIHAAYISAGSEVIQTNTYNANRIILTELGLENEIVSINKKAIHNARLAIDNSETSLLGNLSGINSPGMGRTNETPISEIIYSFQEQLNILLDEGVDGIILETFYDIDELKIVLKIARKTTNLPIVANVTMQEVGFLSNGLLFSDALDILYSEGADIVGTNCVLSPSQMVRAFEPISVTSEKVLSAYPNASILTYNDGEYSYQSSFNYFEKASEELRLEGIGLLGGCCGTTPDHIRAMLNGLKSREIVSKKGNTLQKKNEITIAPVVINEHIDDLVKKKCTVLVELDPPRTLDTSTFFKGIEALNNINVDKITIADNSMARPRISNVVLASMIKDRYGITPLIHMTARDHNLIGLTSQIMGMNQLELFDILALTGDPASIGDFPGASSVYDTSSIGLIKMIKQFNGGIAYTGKNLKAYSDFHVGAAFNPYVRNFERAVKSLHRKQEAGADYIITQPIYDSSLYMRLKESLAENDISIPIFIGIQPLVSSRNAEFIHNEIPGIRLTDEVRERMKLASENGTETETGIQISKELILDAKEFFKGLCLVTPFQRYEITTELANFAKQG